jgi:hypothetical protein
MRAGAAEIRLELPDGIPMMGYGARTGRAAGEHDPLHVRALWLEDGGGRVLIVQLEVCLLAVLQAEALRDRVARAAGLDPGEVWIAATHTHSGPETGIAESLAGEPPPAWMAPVHHAAEAAARGALHARVPARAGLAVGRAEIGRNRREADGDVDRDVVVLRVDAAEAGGDAPLAVAFVHGTHPTVLGHENLAWSADWPGAAAARVREAFPTAVPLFLLGAHADVDPRTRGLQDLAVAGQSAGAGYEACQALGREVGDAVVEAASKATLHDDWRVEARSARVPLAVHGGADDAAAERALAERAAEAARALGLDPAEPLRVSRALALEAERTAGLDPDERRERLARVRLFVRDRTAARIAGGRRPDVEVRLLRLGDAVWLGLPAEATAELGLAWKAGRPAGSALLSNVGGWLRYLPHPDRFRAPHAHHHYEVLMSTLEPEAAARLLEAGAALEAA